MASCTHAKLVSVGISKKRSPKQFTRWRKCPETPSTKPLDVLRNIPGVGVLHIEKCNRNEVVIEYNGSEEYIQKAITTYFSDFSNVNKLEVHRDEHVVHRIFRVACGLESDPQGDRFVQRQLSQARDKQQLTPLLSQLIKQAVKCGSKLNQPISHDLPVKIAIDTLAEHMDSAEVRVVGLYSNPYNNKMAREGGENSPLIAVINTVWNEKAYQEVVDMKPDAYVTILSDSRWDSLESQDLTWMFALLVEQQRRMVSQYRESNHEERLGDAVFELSRGFCGRYL